MSAAQPKASEPSMEEILASIRRIISDDQATKPSTPEPALQPKPVKNVAAAPVAVARPAAQPPADDDDDVLDLAPKPVARKPDPHFITDDPVENDLSFADAAPAPAKVEAPQGQDDIDALMAAAEFDPTPPAPAVIEVPAVAHPAAPPSADSAPNDRLVSPATDRMVSTAFSSLANTVLANNARTLDDLVQDMMRPMIKNWLDDNLPGIVERLVRAEIERVSRGGR